MLKSEEAFNAFLDTLPLWAQRTDAMKGALLKAFIAGGEFGAQFTLDEFKRRAESQSNSAPEQQ